MSELVQIGPTASKAGTLACQPLSFAPVLWLQGFTILWMLVVLGVSSYAAWTAHRPVTLVFRADSPVEVLSASVILLQFKPAVALSREKADRAAGLFSFVLTLLVTGLASASLVLRIRSRAGYAGIGITFAALIALAALAGLAANAVFHTQWLDSHAGLEAIPVLIKEGRSAWQGHACGCC